MLPVGLNKHISVSLLQVLLLTHSAFADSDDVSAETTMYPVPDLPSNLQAMLTAPVKGGEEPGEELCFDCGEAGPNKGENGLPPITFTEPDAEQAGQFTKPEETYPPPGILPGGEVLPLTHSAFADRDDVSAETTMYPMPDLPSNLQAMLTAPVKGGEESGEELCFDCGEAGPNKDENGLPPITFTEPDAEQAGQSTKPEETYRPPGILPGGEDDNDNSPPMAPEGVSVNDLAGPSQSQSQSLTQTNGILDMSSVTTHDILIRERMARAICKQLSEFVATGSLPAPIKQEEAPPGRTGSSDPCGWWKSSKCPAGSPVPPGGCGFGWIPCDGNQSPSGGSGSSSGVSMPSGGDM